MEFQISKSAISKVLASVNGAVEKRNTIPILLNVKIEAKNGNIYLTATDMDIVISANTEALVNKEGETTIPAQLFYDIIRKIPDNENIKIKFEEEVFLVKITYGKSQFSLPCLDPSEFPILTEGAMDTSFDIKSKDIMQLIDQTRFAIPSDETRYYLNGLFLHALEINAKIELRAVATDGHRLALGSCHNENIKNPFSGIIIPKKTITEIRKIIEGNEEAKFSFSKNKIKISSGNSEIISKLIDGQFPEYDRIIPKDNDKIIKLNRKAIFNSIDRVATIATDKNKSIKFTLETNKISLQVKTNDNGNGSEEIAIEYEGETIETGFNSRYFLEIINQIDKDIINIHFKNNISPVLINTEEKNSLYVIMPIRV